MSNAKSAICHRALVVTAMAFLVSCGAWAFESEVLSVPKATQQAVAGAAAFEEAGGLAIEYASLTVFDTTPPTLGTVTAPSHVQTTPLDISFEGLSDGEGSGLAKATLWMKQGTDGAWSATDLSYEFQPGETGGAITYTDLLGEDVYLFDIRVEDAAGNLSPEPTDTGAAQIIIDNTPPELTLVGPQSTIVEVGATFSDPGATASDSRDGDLTSSVQSTGSVDTGTLGTYSITYTVTDTAGNEADPVVRSVTVVEPTSSFALDVIQPEFGGITAEPGPTAPNNRYTPGTEVVLTYAGTNTYTAGVWSGASSVAGDNSTATVFMDSNKSVSLTLERATGTVNVDVTPDNASWRVTDGDGGAHNGAGDSALDVPTGSVSITYNTLEGHSPPSNESAFLQKGGSVNFAGVYEEGTLYRLSAPRNLQALPGDTVTCPISLDNGTDVTGYSLALDFDSDLVSVDSVSAGGATSGWGQPATNNGAGSVTISGSGPALGGAGGVIATITFRVNDSVSESGFTELTFANTSLTSPDGPIPGVSASNGKLAVELGDFVWGDADGDGAVNATDASVLLNFSVENLDTLPVSDAEGDPDYIGGANVSGEEPAIIGPYDAGLVLQKVAGIIDTFPPDENGDGTGPDFGDDKAGTFTDSLLKQIDESIARTVRIAGSVTLEPGALIEIPIGIDAGSRVLGYRVELTYDSSVLSFESADKGKLTQEWLSPVLRSEPGRLIIAAAGAEDAAGTGSLAIARFRVSGGVSSGDVTQMTIADAMLNDGQIEAQTQDNVYAPELTGITPARGANFGGTVVVLRGVNMGDVDTVYFGDAPSNRVSYQPDVNLLTAVAPAGAGTVDISVSALGQTSTLDNAFTYFEPDISLYPDPQTSAVEGEYLDIPVVLGGLHAGRAQVLDFTLHYDRKVFTIRRNLSIDQVIMPGPAAPSAFVTGEQVKPGEWRFTIDGPMESGVVCAVSLLTVRSGGSETEALVYISDVESSNPGVKLAGNP